MWCCATWGHKSDDTAAETIDCRGRELVAHRWVGAGDNPMETTHAEAVGPTIPVGTSGRSRKILPDYRVPCISSGRHRSRSHVRDGDGCGELLQLLLQLLACLGESCEASAVSVGARPHTGQGGLRVLLH